MAKNITLKNKGTGETLYPNTLSENVYIDAENKTTLKNYIQTLETRTNSKIDTIEKDGNNLIFKSGETTIATVEVGSNIADTTLEITDAEKNFTADSNNKKYLSNVLNQLFQFANNGKNSIATAIGSPLTSSDTFTQMTTKIDTLKSTLARNLVAKGQTAISTNT